MTNKIIEISKELYKTLEHKNGARTEEFHFFGYYDYYNELTFCIKFIYEFCTPLLLICRGAGGESVCRSIEYYPEFDEISETVNEFLDEYNITVTEIWVYDCDKDWNRKFLNDITNNQFEDNKGYIKQTHCIVEKQNDNIRYFTMENEMGDFEENYERYLKMKELNCSNKTIIQLETSEMINITHKVISNGNSICFVINTKGDEDFWWWEISKTTWNDYWKDKNPACLIGSIMEWAANEFVNSDECSDCGCSCAGFETVEDAIEDYLTE